MSGGQTTLVPAGTHAAYASVMCFSEDGIFRRVAFLFFATTGLVLYAFFGDTVWFVNHLVIAVCFFMLGLEAHILLVDRCKVMRGRTLSAVAAGLPYYMGREFGQYSCVHERPTGFDYTGLFVPIAGVLGLFVLLWISDAEQADHSDSPKDIEQDSSTNKKKKIKKKRASPESQELSFVSVDEDQ